MAERFLFKGYYVTLKDDETGTAQRGEDPPWKFKYDKKTGAVEAANHESVISQTVVDHIRWRIVDVGTKARFGRKRVKF